MKMRHIKFRQNLILKLCLDEEWIIIYSRLSGALNRE